MSIYGAQFRQITIQNSKTMSPRAPLPSKTHPSQGTPQDVPGLWNCGKGTVHQHAALVAEVTPSFSNRYIHGFNNNLILTQNLNNLK